MSVSMSDNLTLPSIWTLHELQVVDEASSSYSQDGADTHDSEDSNAESYHANGYPDEDSYQQSSDIQDTLQSQYGEIDSSDSDY